MSFQLNNEQQMAIYDSLFLLTGREIKYLKGSWAETFSKKIFSFIEEDRFRILYSDNPAFSNSLMFDIRYQHALHTTSFQEQPVSENSLTNFRAAVYNYNQEHGIDLIQEEKEAHVQVFSKFLKIEGKTIYPNEFPDGKLLLPKIILLGNYLLHSCAAHKGNR